MAYEPSRIEPQWQQWWDDQRTFVATEDRTKTKFYALDMFPYPSGKGLHVGHPAGYTASDVVCRYKRARGFNVLHPMGYDSFGLPAEQKAIEDGVPPQKSTAQSVLMFRGQLKRLGYSYDWSREVSTCEPPYYKWTQYIFTLLYKRSLAYQAEAFVNWCPALGTVLANDEVIDGKSERGGHPVFRIQMRQWMLRITAFAERLLAGLDTIDWPEATRLHQKDWIGRSEGARVQFKVEGHASEVVEVFTTRPDTLWGATFMVVAPEHPMVLRITSAGQQKEVEAYVKEASSKSEKDRQAAKKKTGVDTGARAINPATGKPIPIFIADYVIYGYGTGAIMAVPGHDERDWEFARAFNLPIVEVISGGNVEQAAHAGEGAMVNSGPFTGVSTVNGEAKKQVINWLEKENLGKREVTYKFRDWVFARQRYWGEPIPVLKDANGAIVRTLDVDELPLTLPPVENYKPLGTGQSPLAAAKEWVAVEDKKTGRALQRETDTMPGSAGSSWYFLRYCDPHNEQELCSREKSDYWMPVDLYVGGAEHRVGHLLYSRMWQKVLKDEGLVRDEEPFQKLVHQGMILGHIYRTPDKHIVPMAEVEERDGKPFKKGTDIELLTEVGKMSKRYGNVVNPDDVIKLFGADALRVYICFMGPLESDKPWQTSGMEGQYNWLRRAWRVFFDEEDRPRVTDKPATEEELRIIHKAIKKVGHDIDVLSLNTSISALHVVTRDFQALGTTSRACLEPLAQLMQPFAPHFAEEVWAKALGHQNGISFAPWPAFEERYATDDTVTIGVQVLGKVRGEVKLHKEADEATAVAEAKKDANVQKYLEGKELVKVVYKAGKILNFIIKP